MRYAGFWRRALASIIDTTLLFITFYILKTILENNPLLLNIVYMSLCAFYYVCFTASKHQATIGQILLKIKIGNLLQERLSIGAAALRHFLVMLPYLPFLIYASFPSVIEASKNIELCNTVTDRQQKMACIESSGALDISQRGSALVSIALLIWFISVITLVFSKEKAGIHDRLCKQRAFLNR